VLISRDSESFSLSPGRPFLSRDFGTLLMISFQNERGKEKERERGESIKLSLDSKMW